MLLTFLGMGLQEYEALAVGHIPKPDTVRIAAASTAKDLPSALNAALDLALPALVELTQQLAASHVPKP